jgi:hypothetical protein
MKVRRGGGGERRGRTHPNTLPKVANTIVMVNVVLEETPPPLAPATTGAAEGAATGSALVVLSPVTSGRSCRKYTYCHANIKGEDEEGEKEGF